VRDTRLDVGDWPFATNFTLGPDVSFWGKAEDSLESEQRRDESVHETLFPCSVQGALSGNAGGAFFAHDAAVGSNLYDLQTRGIAWALQSTCTKMYQGR
jgi:hypothetical protein